MDPATLQVFQRELTCPICMNFFLDPVTIDCGHNFCRSCLSLNWEEVKTPMCCPMCKEMSEKTNFKTNDVLKKLAAASRQDRLNQVTRLQEQVPVAQTEAEGILNEVDKSRLDNGLRKKVACHYVRLSEDLRSAIFGEEHCGAHSHSQRAQCFAVLGSQTFTSGKLYWEVDALSSCNWILGVCNDSSTSDTSDIINLEESFLLASLKSNNHYVLPTSVPPWWPVIRPLDIYGWGVFGF
ncbi:tripartite motif-containing protein 64-like [Oryctolagus cuniculus]|uniref:tripartite motif-containing protein 64-like n=1 Tax=Oryctolagus cuniculus TaxID=9986 RepID=UPI00387A5DE6